MHDLCVAHPWLGEAAGAERVLLRIADMWPDAPLATLWWEEGRWRERLGGRRVVASPLQRWPGIRRQYRSVVPFLGAWAAGRVPAVEARVLLTNCHGFAKGIRVAEGGFHLCYCYTPIRWLHDQADAYRDSLPAWRRAAFDLLAPRLRAWEREAAARVDRFIAISKFVAARLRRAFGRQADVIHPPVDTDAFTPGPGEECGHLLVSRMVPYKRVATAVRAFGATGEPLTVVGVGDGGRLAASAPANVRFVGRVSEERLLALYRGADALVFTAEEDFGLAPVEAMACGTPVVALGRGGALETVVDGVTGVLYGDDEPEALAAAVVRLRDDPAHPEACRARAEEFAPGRFAAALAAAVGEAA